MSEDGIDPIPGLVRGQKACHRFMIPSAWGEQQPVSGLDRGGKIVMRQQMGFVPCIKDHCVLWNTEKAALPKDVAGECWEVTQARATARIAVLKWDEVIGSEH